MRRIRNTCRIGLEAAAHRQFGALPRSIAIDSIGRVRFDPSVGQPDVELTDCLVFPGLVNSHDHLEFNLYPPLLDPPYRDVDQWARDVHRYYRDIVARIESIPFELRWHWGLLKNLVSGVTSVMQHSVPAASVGSELPVRVIERYRFVHRADKAWAWLKPRFAAGSGPLVFHVAEGTSKAVGRRSRFFLRRLAGNGPLVGVHGILLDQEAAGRLDALVWCPVSNMALFGRTADIAALKSETEILFGTDSTISAPGTIWDHLRIARSMGQLDDAELYAAVTSNAWRTWNIGGSDDIVVARRLAPNPWEAFFRITPADILAVVSKNRLAVIAEEFAKHLGIELDSADYPRICIGKSVMQVRCGTGALLDRLAELEGAPLQMAVS